MESAPPQLSNSGASSSRSRIVRGALAFAIVAAGVTAVATTAQATGSPDLPFKVTASPTVYLQDGDTISVNVDGRASSNGGNATTIYEVKANICKPDSSISFDADFWPTQTGKCLLDPLSTGTSDEVVVVPAPEHQTNVGLAYKAGVGTQTYAYGPNAVDTTITCNPANPCQLVVRISSDDATPIRFASFPVTYWDGVSATTSSSTSSTSSSSTSSTSTTITTSTTLPKPNFPDVAASNPFKSDIEWLVQNGIAKGYGDGTFKPGLAVTRQAAASFLYKLAGSPNFTTPANASFKDVPKSHAFFKEIEWLVSSRIASGFSDGTFKPTGDVTRQALASFLYKYAGSPAFNPGATPKFKDVPTSHTFSKAIEWLADANVVLGSNGSFRPTSPVIRQAAASFIHKFDTNVPK